MATKRNMKLNADDLNFLEDLGRYGALSTNDAADYYPEYKRNSVQKRVRLLADNRLTMMTKLEVWTAVDAVDESERQKGGRIPTLHTLTEEGAHVVANLTGELPPRITRKRPSPTTMLHRTEIVRMMRAFDRACDQHRIDRPDWVMEQDLWPQASQKLPPNQRCMLYHDFGGGVTCAPDLACLLKINGKLLAMFWEIDMSSEGRKQIRKASKTTGYVRLFNSHGYHRYWPDAEVAHRFVMWVASTQQRVDSLCEALREKTIASRCRFLASGHLDTHCILSHRVWQDIDGEMRSIYTPRDH